MQNQPACQSKPSRLARESVSHRSIASLQIVSLK